MQQHKPTSGRKYQKKNELFSGFFSQSRNYATRFVKNACRDSKHEISVVGFDYFFEELNRIDP
jgi:hypothetical protein